MFKRNFFGAGPWDGARGIPTVRLAGHPRLGQQGGNGCVVPGTQERPVFQYNPTTKVCGVTWMSPSTTPYPDCVQAPPGYPGGGYNGWIPPSCMPEQAPKTPEPPPEPPPGEMPPGLACPMGNGLFTLLNYATGEIIAENITRDQFSQYTDNVTDLAPDQACSDDSRCAPICNISVVEPPYDGVPPAPEVPAPVPAPAPSPAPVAPPVTQVSPGASVPIAPGPFPSAAPPPSVPIRSGQMPSSAPPPVPQRGFAPATIRPMCQPTKYKTPLFSPTTKATRPDQFVEKQQWTQ